MMKLVVEECVLNIERLGKTIRQIMRKKKTPGLALSVWQNNAPIYSKGFGSRSLKPSLPMTSDTLMGIGSITKSFTAFAILKLEEAGKLTDPPPTPHRNNTTPNETAQLA